MERTVTGANDITHPHLHVWDWTVDIYLYLGGLAAGLLIISGIAMLKKWTDRSSMNDSLRGAQFAPFMLALGMLFIFLHLDRKMSVYWFYLSFQPYSPMWWGAWAITITIPVSFIYGVTVMSEENRDRYLPNALKILGDTLQPHIRKLAVINFCLGILVGIYTGLLLSSMHARPLWNSPVLPVLFLNSSICTGTAFMIILAKRFEVKIFLTKINIFIIITEMVLILLFSYGLHVSSASQQAALAPFTSAVAEHLPYFICALLIIILFPLAELFILKYFRMPDLYTASLTKLDTVRIHISAVIVLIGVLIIRVSILYAGQLSKIL